MAHEQMLLGAPARERVRHGAGALADAVRVTLGPKAKCVLVGRTWGSPLPRGGVPVGCEVAREPGVPLDVLMVRKLGLPGHEELAMGAIAAAGPSSFLLDVSPHGAIAATLHEPRLQRAIGVICRPETERRSHYFHASLPSQIDAALHYDATHAVEPLERTGRWMRGELPETYPSAL